MNYLALAVICIAGIGEDSGFGLYRAYDQNADGRVEKIVGKFTLSKPEHQPETIYLDKKPILNSDDVLTATGEIEQGQAVIDITFKRKSGKILYEATEGLVGNRLAVVLDGNVLVAPVVRSPIGKDVRLTGDFDKVLVDLLVKRLNR